MKVSRSESTRTNYRGIIDYESHVGKKRGIELQSSAVPLQPQEEESKKAETKGSNEDDKNNNHDFEDDDDDDGTSPPTRKRVKFSCN